MFHSMLLTLGAATSLGLGTLMSQDASTTSEAGCPGQITCPLTAEMICADQCPLDTNQKASELPPCCRN